MVNLNATTTNGERPIDFATNDKMRQAIVNEEKRRRDHGFRRAVLRNPIAAERATSYLICLEEESTDDQGQTTASAVTEGAGQGQASANAVPEEGDDDSGSDEEHEVAYWRSQKRRRTE